MTAVTETLSRNLSAMIALHLVAKHAHWNVRGDGFMPTHKLFDKIAEDAEDYADSIGETIAYLEEEAVGTPAATAKSYLGPYTVGIDDCQTHLKAILECLKTSMIEIKSAIRICLNAMDQTSADVLIEVSRGISKNIYFVKSSISRRKVGE